MLGFELVGGTHLPCGMDITKQNTVLTYQVLFAPERRLRCDGATTRPRRLRSHCGASTEARSPLQHNFADFPQARRAIIRWLDWYNRQRPHQSLDYLSPQQYRQQSTKVA